MPARSQKQFRYFKAIAEGNLKPGPSGPSKKVATEFVAGQSPAGLPRQVEKKRPAKKGKG